MFLYLTSCKSTGVYHNDEKIITTGCELNKRINDTVLISGIYSNCMEYSSFNVIEKASCYDLYDMDLDLNLIEFTPKLEKRFNEMQGCGVSMKMILKGILRKDSKADYGHLGTNNSLLEVIEVIDYGKVNYYKLEAE